MIFEKARGAFHLGQFLSMPRVNHEYPSFNEIHKAFCFELAVSSMIVE